jgi:hypothetical protein
MSLPRNRFLKNKCSLVRLSDQRSREFTDARYQVWGITELFGRG